METQTGIKPKLLKEEGFPIAGSGLWVTYWQLNSSRSSDSGIPYTEIDAYARLTQVPFDPWEVETLMLMDAEYVRFVNGIRTQSTNKRKS